MLRKIWLVIAVALLALVAYIISFPKDFWGFIVTMNDELIFQWNTDARYVIFLIAALPFAWLAHEVQRAFVIVLAAAVAITLQYPKAEK